MSLSVYNRPDFHTINQIEVHTDYPPQDMVADSIFGAEKNSELLEHYKVGTPCTSCK